jgi:hypothetical protein
MSIGLDAGGGSTGIQRNQIQENSGPVSTEQKADSVVRPIIDFLIEKARNASIAKLALSWDKPADLALISAAKNGELEKVQEILNQKEHGYVSIGVAIRKAAINGHLDIVQKLLASDIGETLFYSNEEVIRKNFPDAPKDIKEVFVGDCEGAITLILGDEKLKDENYQDILKQLAQASLKGFGEVVLRADRIEDKKLRQQFLENFCDENHFDIEKLMSACLNEGADFFGPDVLRILGKLSDDMRVGALVVVANSGRSYLFKEILGDLKAKDFERFDLQEILAAMIKGGLRDLVFSFLDEVEDPAEKKELIRFAFQTAVQSGQLPVLEELFKKYEIDSLHIKVAIFHVAKIGNTECAMLLIKKLVEREDLEFFNPEGTLIHALANGMVELTQKLSPEFIEISKPLLQKALECASQNTIYRPQVIEELLGMWKELPAENTDFFEYRDQGFELVIRAAIENNNQSLIDQLLKLQLPLRSEYFRDILVDACSQAIQKGRKEIFLILYTILPKSCKLNREIQGMFVKSAVETKQLEILRMLDKGAIDPSFRQKMVDNARAQGCCDIADELLKRGFALYALAQQGNLNEVEQLLPALPRSLQFLNQSVDAPLQNDRIEGLEAFRRELLHNFDRRAISQGIQEAVKFGHVDLLKYLVPFIIILTDPLEYDFTGSFSDKFFEKALPSAAHHGHLNVIEFFLSEYFSLELKSSYPISQTVVVAITAQRNEIVNLLLSRFEQLPGEWISERQIIQWIGTAAYTNNFPIIARLMRDSQNQIRTLDQEGLTSVIDSISHLPNYPTSDLIRTICENLTSLTPRFKDFLLEHIRSLFTGLSLEQQEILVEMINRLPIAEVRNDPSEQEMASISHGYLHVPNWEDVKNNPLKYLTSAVKKPFEGIFFGDGTAVDAGGVTKDFVTRLVESLKEKKLICTDEDLGFGEWVSLPIATTKEQIEALSLFGKLLTHLYIKNDGRRDKIMIPKILDPRLFAVMLAGEGNELKILESPNEFQKIWENSSTPSQDSISLVKSLTGFEGENELFMDEFRGWKASVQKALSLLKAGIGTPLTQAMQTFQGCMTLKNEFFGKEITSELVKRNLEIRAPQMFPDTYGNMVEWLREWIDKADDEKLIQFVFCTTGHKSLNMGNIIIKQNDQRNQHKSEAVEIHSCCNSLALPRVENMDQESFILALEASLVSEGKVSYNLA